MWRSIFYSLAALMIPALAWACPVCFWANPKGRTAYLGTTLLLVLLPITLLVAGGWWVYRDLKKPVRDH